MQKARVLLSKNSVNEALDKIMETIEGSASLDKNYIKSLILIISDYGLLKREVINQTISNADFILRNSQIMSRALSLIENLEDENFDNVNKSSKLYIPTEIVKINFEASSSKIKVLFLLFNPSNSSRQEINEEVRDLESELLKSMHRDKFDINIGLAIKTDSLQDLLLGFLPNIIYVSGSSSENSLLLHDDRLTSKNVKLSAFSALLSMFSDKVACVLFNIKLDDKDALLFSRSINYVIYQQEILPMEAKKNYSSTFFKALGAGKDIRFSHEFGKNGLLINGMEKWVDSPKLLEK